MKTFLKDPSVKLSMSAESKPKPKVSIIMSTHNRAHIIGRAIRSVLRQTLKNFELIIVNDGSTDNTKEVVLSSKNKRIIYLEKSWGGLASSRNFALKHANGEYIAYLDDDDEYLPQHLERLANFFDSHPEFGMVYSDSRFILDKTKTLFPYRSIAFDKRKLEVGNFMPNCAIMHRKTCLEKVGFFDEKIFASSDKDMWLRISDRYKVGHLPKVTNIVYVDKAAKLTAKSKDFYYYIIRKRIRKAKKEERLIKYINDYSIKITKDLVAFKKLKCAQRLTKEFYRVIKNYQTLACLGICNMAKGNFQEASYLFRKSISKLPRNWRKLDSWQKKNIFIIKIDLARAYYHLNRIEEAIKICQEVLKITPYNSDARLQLAKCYIRKNLDQKAFQVVKDIKFVSEVHNLRGYYYFKQKRFKVAAKEFNTAWMLNPNIAGYHYNLASAYTKLGKYNEAKKEYEIAIQLEPKCEQTKKAIISVNEKI